MTDTSQPIRTFLRIALLIVGVLLAITAYVPLLPVDWWWVRVGDFPRVQLLVGYLACAMALLPFCRRLMPKLVVATLFGAAAIQVYWIYPYLPFAAEEVQLAQSSEPQRRLRLMSSNVLQGNVAAASKVLELVAEQAPDVLVLCEVDKRWLAALRELRMSFPFHLEHPLDNKYGMAVYSKLKLEGAHVRHFVKVGIPSIDAILELRTGHRVRLLAVHPNPPRPGEGTTKRDAELVLVGRDVSRSPSAIVLGDMNDVGWSRTTNLFQEVSRLLDPRKGRGLYPTYDATSMIWRYPLDHVFHSSDFRLVEMRTLPSVESDHFPLWVELSYEPSASSEQRAPDFNADDAEDAQEAVDAADEHLRDGGR